MSERIVLCLSHSIEEYDQLKLLSSLGYEVFSLGGYINPQAPHDPKRPALPDVRHYPELQAAVDSLGTEDNLAAAQERIPDAILDWADTIIFHHYLGRLYNQWDRIKDWKAGDANRRVIWRTVGQSLYGNELEAQQYRADGLEIVRYSPKERNIPHFAGEDALIRFYKDPDEWYGWTGDLAMVINITQHLQQRGPHTNWPYWERTTVNLPRMALGPGSEAIGGPGEMTLAEMQAWLRLSRVYLYTGTQPASYTLGLIEAMMTGIPVVSITPDWMRMTPYSGELFEGHEIALLSGDPGTARRLVQDLLEDHDKAAIVSEQTRQRSLELFGRDVAAGAWRTYLS